MEIFGITQFFKKLKTFVEKRPAETEGTLLGGTVGTFLGLKIGGMGLALLGGAISLPAILVLPPILALIGNRVGVEKDRNSSDTPKKDPPTL